MNSIPIWIWTKHMDMDKTCLIGQRLVVHFSPIKSFNRPIILPVQNYVRLNFVRWHIYHIFTVYHIFTRTMSGSQGRIVGGQNESAWRESRISCIFRRFIPLSIYEKLWVLIWVFIILNTIGVRNNNYLHMVLNFDFSGIRTRASTLGG